MRVSDSSEPNDEPILAHREMNLSFIVQKTPGTRCCCHVDGSVGADGSQGKFPSDLLFLPFTFWQNLAKIFTE